MAKKNITKGKIGNALTSTAADHIVAVAQDIFDEALQLYQSEVNQQSQGVMQFLGVAAIKSELFSDGYIPTGVDIGTIIDIYTPVSDEDYRCVVIACNPGDKFTINGNGGALTRLWAFTNRYGKLLDSAVSGVHGSNIVIEAPANAAYVVLNDYEKTGTFFVGETSVNKTNEKFDKLIHTITNDSYLAALVDNHGHILTAIKADGEIFVPKGMSEDAKKAIAALNTLLNKEIEDRSALVRSVSGNSASTYLYALVDASGKILIASYRDGTTYIPKGVPEDVKVIVKIIESRLDFLEDKVRIAKRSDMILAFVDSGGNLLGGWKSNGEIYIPSGMSEDSKKEFAEIHKTVDLYEGGFAVE